MGKEPVVVMKDEGIRKKNDGSNGVCIHNKNESGDSISNGCFSQYC